MRWLGRWSPRLGLAGVAALVGLALPFREVVRFQPGRPRSPPADGTEIRGAIHVHSNRSDGRASPEAIARAARQAGLDFVILTDHQDYQALGRDRYEEGVLLLTGIEISAQGGHIAALGISEPDFRFDVDPRSVISDIGELGGFSVACHPFSRHPDRRWEDGSVNGYDALEVVNWAENVEPLSWAALAGFAASPLNARYGLLRGLGPIGDGLRLWDELSSRRPMVGLAAADAHGGIRLAPGWFFPFPGYQQSFELWSDHLLLREPLEGDPAADRSRVLEALRAGRLFFALDGLAPAAGFRFFVRAPGAAMMGESVELGDGVNLEVQAPEAPVEIVLRKDGRETLRLAGPRLSYRAFGSGVYRVEVFWRGKDSPVAPDIPWIVSNPIYLGGSLERRSLPPPPSVPPGGVLFDDFERGLGEWQTWADPSSVVSRPFIDAAEGAEGSPSSAFFDFVLGGRSREGKRSACALVVPAPPELRRASGLSFYCRATGTFRFDLQLRDLNPRSSDGLEPWRDSVKTSTDWQPIFIPFDQLKSYHRASDGRLDPDQIREIAFYLDTATTRPEARGRIWIDRLRWHP